MGCAEKKEKQQLMTKSNLEGDRSTMPPHKFAMSGGKEGWGKSQQSRGGGAT